MLIRSFYANPNIPTQYGLDNIIYTCYNYNIDFRKGIVCMIRVAIYARKSKFTAKGESIENQIRDCTDYINTVLKKRVQNQYGEVEFDISIYKDEGYSGKNLERPQFKKMMEDTKYRPFDYIVVYRLDRVSRNLADFSQLIAKLKHSGTAFISYKEDFDTATPMGQAMMSIAAVFAQLERDTIAERIKDNMYNLAKLGHWTGGTTPLGYRSVQHTRQDGAKTRTYYTLEIDPDQEQIVKIIFEKYLELHSINAVELYLNDNHYLTQRGKRWDKSNVRRILVNPVYCSTEKAAYDYFTELGSTICFDAGDFNSDHGIMPYNRTVSDKRKLTTPDKWLIATSTHRPIIDADTWVSVQRILEERSTQYFGGKSKNRVPRNNTALLSGILKCSCGAYMRPTIYQSGNTYYICETKAKNKKYCDTKNLPCSKVDSQVLNILFSYDIQDTPVQAYIDSMHQRITTIDEDLKQRTDQLKSKQAENVDAIRNLMKAMTLGASPESIKYMNEYIAELTQQNADIDVQIDALESRESIKDSICTNISDLCSALCTLRDNFDTLSIHQRRDFVKRLIDHIVWDGSDIHIFISGSDT